MKRLKILTPSYYAIFSHNYSYAIKIYYNKINESELDINQYNAKAAAYSLLLTTKQIDVADYMKNYQNKNISGQEEFIQINDLIKAYEFAQKHNITNKNILKLHALAYKNSLETKFRGKFRKTEIYITNTNSVEIYKAPNYKWIIDAYNRFVEDIEILLKRDLRLNQIFYYASYIHAWFWQISPFIKGSGVIARILEKWFIASKLDNRAWYIPSEEYYYNNREDYFENFRKIGAEFEKRNFEYSEDFFLMLTKSIELNITTDNPDN